MNIYKEGDKNINGMVLKHFNLPICWEDCKKQSKFEEVSKEIEEFNRLSIYLLGYRRVLIWVKYYKFNFPFKQI